MSLNRLSQFRDKSNFGRWSQRTHDDPMAGPKMLTQTAAPLAQVPATEVINQLMLRQGSGEDTRLPIGIRLS